MSKRQRRLSEPPKVASPEPFCGDHFAPASPLLNRSRLRSGRTPSSVSSSSPSSKPFRVPSRGCTGSSCQVPVAPEGQLVEELDRSVAGQWARRDLEGELCVGARREKEGVEVAEHVLQRRAVPVQPEIEEDADVPLGDSTHASVIGPNSPSTRAQFDLPGGRLGGKALLEELLEIGDPVGVGGVALQCGICHGALLRPGRRRRHRW